MICDGLGIGWTHTYGNANVHTHTHMHRQAHLTLIVNPCIQLIEQVCVFRDGTCTTCRVVRIECGRCSMSRGKLARRTCGPGQQPSADTTTAAGQRSMLDSHACYARTYVYHCYSCTVSACEMPCGHLRQPVHTRGTHTHTNTQHACTHTRTHSHTHARTHTHTHAQ